jgi:hypothetical protein
MRTDQLIAELASTPPSRIRPGIRVAGAIAAGWLVALIGLALNEGAPMAAVAHTGVAPFAVKLGYALALASLATIAAIAAGRPGRKLSGSIALLTVPVVLVVAMALIELASADRTEWNRMMFGATYWSCFASVVIASLPVFAGMVWSYRTLAPTRLALAGFLVGLSAGAAGAVAFALYCHESTAAFLVTAYTPAMLTSALLGCLVARPLLKW